MTVEILDGPSKSVVYPGQHRKRGWSIREMKQMSDLVVIRHDDLERLERIAKSFEAIKKDCIAILKEAP